MNSKQASMLVEQSLFFFGSLMSLKIENVLSIETVEYDKVKQA